MGLVTNKGRKMCRKRIDLGWENIKYITCPVCGLYIWDCECKDEDFEK